MTVFSINHMQWKRKIFQSSLLSSISNTGK